MNYQFHYRTLLDLAEMMGYQIHQVNEILPLQESPRTLVLDTNSDIKTLTHQLSDQLSADPQLAFYEMNAEQETALRIQPPLENAA